MVIISAYERLGSRWPSQQAPRGEAGCAGKKTKPAGCGLCRAGLGDQRVPNSTMVLPWAEIRF